jgi:hypothetical protein
MYRYMLACFDTCFRKTNLYRYKHTFVSIQTRENRFIYQFSFIHSSKPSKLIFSTRKSTEPLIPNYQISLKTQPKLTKIVTKPSQIHHSSTFLHQFGGSKPQISTFKGFINLGFVKILQVLRQKFKVIHSTS